MVVPRSARFVPAQSGTGAFLLRRPAPGAANRLSFEESAKNMAKQKQEKFVSEITPRDTDFAQWYTDVIKKTDLVD